MRHESEIEVPILPSDPTELRDALIREMDERRHSECLAKVHTDAVQLALDLLAREPDSVESFFGMFTKTLVEECDSTSCDVWLLDEDQHRVDLWMTYQRGALHTRGSPDWDALASPRESMGTHLFAHIAGWKGSWPAPGTHCRWPCRSRACSAEAPSGRQMRSCVPCSSRVGTQGSSWQLLATKPIRY